MSATECLRQEPIIGQILRWPVCLSFGREQHSAEPAATGSRRL